mmetsp:Transcript_98765/g.175840  ORF Transcript_98765/g.175840 Transcript_98765/m.175840 type:complete len:425 (+) Transcript_98765:32-1306(+)
MWTSQAVDEFRKQLASSAHHGNSLVLDEEEVIKRKTGMKKVAVKDQVGALIAPGGVFEKDAAPVKSLLGRPKVSTYDEAFPGLIPELEMGGFAALQAPVVQGPKSQKIHEATHNRCVAHESPAAWRQTLQTSSVLNSAPEDILAAASRAQHRRQGISREDHERRWRRWLKKKEKEEQGAAPSAVTGTVTEASTVPAGMRPAKCIGDSFPDGIRVPLFGEDVPKPIWTTLAAAPWVGHNTEPKKKHEKSETPWTVVDDPSHPLQRKYRDGSSTARASRPAPSVARSGAQSARESIPESGRGQPEDEAAGSAFRPEVQEKKKRGIAKNQQQVREEGPFTQPFPPPQPVADYVPPASLSDKATLPLLRSVPSQSTNQAEALRMRPWGDYPDYPFGDKSWKRSGVLGHLTPRKTSEASSAVKVKVIGS